MKSCARTWGLPRKLSGLGPGEAGATPGVAVKNRNRFRTLNLLVYSAVIPGGAPVAKHLMSRQELADEACGGPKRPAGTAPTVRDESQGSEGD